MVRKIIPKCVSIIYRILQYRQLTLERAPIMNWFSEKRVRYGMIRALKRQL